MPKTSVEHLGELVMSAMHGDEEHTKRWWEAVRKPLPKEWIKQREGPGGKKLDYIEGHKVVELISHASGGRYSFLVLDAFIEDARSVPLKVKNDRGYDDPVVEIICPNCAKPYRIVKRFRQQTAECTHCKYEVPLALYPGDPVMVRQEPIAHVLGMLIVPGVGAVMQWGSKILQGGSTEQEHAYKSAATDAFKKCASMLGVALELYEKETAGSAEAVHAEVYGSNRYVGYDYPELEQQAPTRPAAVAKPAPASKSPEAASAATTADGNGATAREWPMEEVERLKNLRRLMGIPEDNRNALNPLVSAWSQGKITSYQGLTPSNIKDFNDYLESLIYKEEAPQP